MDNSSPAMKIDADFLPCGASGVKGGNPKIRGGIKCSIFRANQTYAYPKIRLKSGFCGYPIPVAWSKLGNSTRETLGPNETIQADCFESSGHLRRHYVLRSNRPTRDAR